MPTTNVSTMDSQLKFLTQNRTSGILNKIHFNLEDENTRLTKMRLDRNTSENYVVPIVTIQANFSLLLNSGQTIYRGQFPLMLSFPCPVQKIQDLTLPSIVSSFNLDREKKFSYGQLYVALKRMKLLRNLCIKGQVTKEALSLDPDGGIEYCRLKTQCCLTT